MRYQIENGTVSLGGKTILNHIDFSIKGQEKIAVVGRNGAGKTTLLRLISGELSLDRDDKRFGKGITTDKAISIGFLHQQSFSNAERTVEEEILSLVSEEDIFSKERYYFEKEYDRIFTGFGFKKEDKCKKIGQFSGGEQTKLAFIKLLLSKPDILLLDEPTNHLDIASVEWLEEYLVSYEKAVIMVSHDRFFIDRTAEIIYELSDGKLMRYVGNYTEYKKQKEKQRVSQQKKYDAQQKEIARLNELIEKFKHKPKKASMARSKKKVLERMQKVEKPDKEEAYIFKEKLEPLMPGAKNVLETEHLKIGYKNPIRELTLRIRRGQKIAVLGANGAGKTTTMKMLLGLTKPTSGEVKIWGKSLQGNEKKLLPRIGSLIESPGFYPNLTGTENLRIFATLRGVPNNHAIKDALDLVGLPYKDKKLFSQYSLGMKQRLAIALAVMHNPELLILDEPINGLDPIGIAEVRDFIRELCDTSGKTILISSHILSEISLLADDVGIIDHGKLLEEESLKELEAKNAKFIHFCVSDAQKAAKIIAATFHSKDFRLTDANNLYLYDMTLPVEKINRSFVESGIEIQEVHLCEDTLEDYFKKITGGEGIA